jgi:hypothetical protein
MPTVDIPDRVCSHCGGTKWYTDIQKNKNSIRYTCVVLSKERSRKNYLNNTEQYKKKARESEKRIMQDPSRRRKLNESRYKWRKKNPEKVKLYKKKSNNRIRKTLQDEYVKRQIVHNTNLSFKDVPPELVELKRKQISLLRQVKTLKTQQHEQEQ